MTEFDDSPVLSWDDITGWIRGFLAAVGLMFLAFLAGLWKAGFFTWAVEKFPSNALLQFFFGGGV